MRDIDRERELLAGLAAGGNLQGGGEALTATGGLVSAAAGAELITQTEKDIPPFRGTQAEMPDDPVETLLRLSQAAALDAEKLTKRIDPVAGHPERQWSKSKLQQARKVAGDMVERLITFLDHCAGDPDHEPTLAVPDHGIDQECLWFSASLCAGAKEDEREHDLDTDEADELDNGEPDLATTECINQEHISQGYGWVTDGEMSLATTENIDQRWASFSGSRTDREADAFPYDPPRHPDQPIDYPGNAARED